MRYTCFYITIVTADYIILRPKVWEAANEFTGLQGILSYVRVSLVCSMKLAQRTTW